jgi:hypothetical protein
MCIDIKYILYIYLLFLDSPNGSRPFHCWGFEIKLRHSTLGRTPLDEWSARRRNLYLTTQTQEKDIHAPGGIWTHHPRKQAVTDPRLLVGRPLGSATDILIAVNLCCFGYNVHVVSNNDSLDDMVREVLRTESSLSRRHYPSGLLSDVLKLSCAAGLQTSVCLTGVVTTLIRYSVKSVWTLKYSDSLFRRNETRIFCVCRIITETCTRIWLNHHFINTFIIQAFFNHYRVIFWECNGYISATCVNKMRPVVKFKLECIV